MEALLIASAGTVQAAMVGRQARQLTAAEQTGMEELSVAVLQGGLQGNLARAELARLQLEVYGDACATIQGGMRGVEQRWG